MYELINNVPLRIKEYNGQRVVTFKDIDTVHNRPEGTARKRFNDNKKHFIEDEDYFILELTTSEIRTQFGAGKNAGRTMILLTESGYLMLVKSFTDELAWSVQRQLVNTYFRVHEISNSYTEFVKTYNANVEEIINRALDERMYGIIKAVKETVEKTSCKTVNTLIPCFDYTHKKLTKLYKSRKK